MTQATPVGQPTGGNVDQEADLVAARRWAATFRRIDRVEFISCRQGTAALIQGVGCGCPKLSREPVTRYFASRGS